MKRSAAMAVLLSSILAGRSGEARVEGGVDELVLANGFRLLVVEDRTVPRVACSMWFRVGGLAEAQGEHGATHFLEHAIHQGTTTVGTRDFEAERPILAEIYRTEETLLGIWNKERNRLRERNVFYDELDWPVTSEMEALRQRLYELEDRDSEFREFWAEYNWYRRYGGRARHTDPVPATTGNEHMDISLDLPKENLELYFRLEADRMVNAVLRGWEAQRFTVFEQILNSHNRPERGRFAQAIHGATGLTHPIYQSAGGHFRDFAYFNRAAMLEMYEKYFVPENATLVLVGDISLEEVRPLAERYFGRLPEGPAAPAKMDFEAEPVPGGAVRLEWMEPLEPRVIVRYRIPGVGHPDRPIMDTIASLMKGEHGLPATTLNHDARTPTGGRAAFQAGAPRNGSPQTISFTALASRDEDLPHLEGLLLRSVDALREGLVAPAGLERARKILRLEWARIRAERGAFAGEIGRFQVADNWKTLALHMEERERATMDDIRRVAQKYFVPSNRIIATSRRRPLDPSLRSSK